MRVEMVDPGAQLISEIDAGATRDQIVSTYAWCIRQASDVDFPSVNAAICKRWSPSGLAYIKTKAWKWIEEREAQA